MLSKKQSKLLQTHHSGTNCRLPCNINSSKHASPSIGSQSNRYMCNTMKHVRQKQNSTKYTLLPLHYLLFQSNVFYLDRGAFFVAENEDKDRETSDAVFWIKRHCHKPNHLPKPFSQLPSMRNSVFWIPIMPLGEHAEAVVRTEVSDHIWSSGVARTWESRELLPRDHRSNVLS
jgi:hypothetical protein